MCDFDVAEHPHRLLEAKLSKAKVGPIGKVIAALSVLGSARAESRSRKFAVEIDHSHFTTLNWMAGIV
eukprot:8406105-Alexandrium_andersonii.AAC.1